MGGAPRPSRLAGSPLAIALALALLQVPATSNCWHHSQRRSWLRGLACWHQFALAWPRGSLAPWSRCAWAATPEEQNLARVAETCCGVPSASAGTSASLKCQCWHQRQDNVAPRCSARRAGQCRPPCEGSSRPRTIHPSSRWPAQSKIRAPLCAARTLKRQTSIPGHAIAAVGALKSSLWATPGGKAPNIRPKPILVGHARLFVCVRRALGAWAPALAMHVCAAPCSPGQK